MRRMTVFLALACACALSLAGCAKDTQIFQDTAADNTAQAEPEPEPAPPEPEPEPDEYEILENPSRVTLNQLAGIDLNYCEKYRPITGEVFHGFVMLKELEGQEDEEEDLKD